MNVTVAVITFGTYSIVIKRMRDNLYLGSLMVAFCGMPVTVFIGSPVFSIKFLVSAYYVLANGADAVVVNVSNIVFGCCTVNVASYQCSVSLVFQLSVLNV